MLNNKKTGGVALLYVVTLLLFLSVISVVLLVAAQATIQQSAFVDTYESMYYDAESALHIALRLFENALTIPASAIGDNEADAVNRLKTALHENLSASKRTAETGAIDYLAAADKTVTVQVTTTINDAAIMTRPLGVDPDGAQISFFGSGIDEDGSVSPATPIIITISATCGTRNASITRTFTVTGGHFEPAVPGSPGEASEGGLWLAGKNLLNGSASWLIYNNTKVKCPDGLHIVNYGEFPPGEIVFPSQNMDALMQPPMNIAGEGIGEGEIAAIFNKARAAYEDPANSVYTVTGYHDPIITPADLLKDDGTYHNVIYGNQGGFTLAGDFTVTGLKAVFFTGVSKVTLGSSSESFSCDKNAGASPASDGNPLYVYIPTISEIVISGKTRVANAKFAMLNTSHVTGNSGSESVYYDAQIYYANPITIGVNESNPLVVNNWDPTGVPSFISTNTMRVYVKSERGFSGIFYTNGVLTASVDAPYMNGAFLMKNTPNLTFKNSSTLSPGAVQLYCEINATAYENLSVSLKNYFNAIIDMDAENGVIGGGEITGETETNARYTTETALTGDTTADRNAIIFES